MPLNAHPLEQDLLRILIAPAAELPSRWHAWVATHDLRRIAFPAYRLLLPLYHRMKHLDSCPLDRDDLALLREVHLQEYSRILRVEEALRPLFHALQRQAIPILLLKGLALQVKFSLPVASRYSGDVDVFVGEHWSRDAVSIVQQHPWKIQEQLWSLERGVEELHAISFKSPDDYELDLHWHALIECPDRVLDDILFESATTVEYLGATCQVPSAETLFLLSAVNGMRRTTKGLYWMYDLWLIGEATHWELDWSFIVQNAWRSASKHSCQQALQELQQNYGFPIPSEVVAQFDRYRPRVIEWLGDQARAQGVRGRWGGLWFRLYFYGRKNSFKPWYYHPYGFYCYLRSYWKVSSFTDFWLKAWRSLSSRSKEDVSVH